MRISYIYNLFVFKKKKREVFLGLKMKRKNIRCFVFENQKEKKIDAPVFRNTSFFFT